mmetsp:Transcript_55804/g.121549  ORF Transcript_55804/g.121549 Transcript_55804/m.121549 type:complete len:102 (+) Transcript_55804:435-740(+)
MESSTANAPVIAFTDTDANLDFIDVAIPSNNKGRHSIAMLYWILAREVLYLRGNISRSQEWEVKVDLFLWKNPDAILQLKEKEEGQNNNKEEFEEEIEGGS